ncbi:endopeptidase La [Blautia liquoris]|uniref:Lon protease n=1 Tax=Blautia liquoris TaxID=2779518 RepID=A0A7M2RH89_9FIRM|nr:endopeptidase La [Blautia liquoris]QOV19706.1 endopeptidase La [Blautia liquoris]
MSNLIRVMPAVTLRGVTILPDMIVHFDVSRDKSVKAVQSAMSSDQKVFLITQRDPEVEHPGLFDVYKVGTIAKIKQIVKMPEGVLRILAEGEDRAELKQLREKEEYLEAEIEKIKDCERIEDDDVKEAMLRSMKELFIVYGKDNPRISKQLQKEILKNDDIVQLMNQISINIPVTYQQRQKILEAASLADRYEQLGLILTKEIQIRGIQSELQQKMQSQIDKNQKDYILREQMKVIREELGDGAKADIDRFREETEKLTASKEVMDQIYKEIDHYENVSNNPAEGAVSRGYIENLLGLPWNKTSRETKDLSRARKILEEDHYGLIKVKERILETLAVRMLTRKGDAPIICLVGPPGTGKTSIAKSVARALKKRYIRISLGGVRDEAEIRGHRRTYVGAMPGRIAAGLHQAGVKNPLMLLDEIDKIGSDYKGDPSSALLEVLDSEQNSKFIDHYIEIPIDLSDVLFIATANDIQTIPRPLVDRMEIIEISSYTENEKMHIAKEHLISKQMKANGIKKGQLIIHDDALEHMISSYTREAGVRGLERSIAQICRRSARLILEEKKTVSDVRTDNLEAYLGKPRYTIPKMGKNPEIGIVNGLAWTSVGGVTLEVEVNVMPGKGAFLLTGSLGDIMKESAQTGISYIRSVAKRYGIFDDFFKENDIHIHIPEGAVPKDGPSAGVTMVTAMISAITKNPIRQDVAMTGEITLRGRVLPIGGLKEKLLAAKKAGITTAFVPDENRPDVEELDKEITDGLAICFVKSIDQILEKVVIWPKTEKIEENVS